MKNGAIRNREDFEKHVKEIGMPQRWFVIYVLQKTVSIPLEMIKFWKSDIGASEKNVNCFAVRVEFCNFALNKDWIINFL